MVNSLNVKTKERKKRPQSLGEEIGNAITHGCGFIFAIVATILMLVKADTAIEYISASIFSFGLLSLYIMSCLYHAFKTGSNVKRIFRFFDHSSIYILIGATYAPVLLLAVGGTVGWVFFIVQWSLIILSIVIKVARPIKTSSLTAILSLIIGWSGLLVLPQVYSFSHTIFWLILSGGISYSIGVIFFALKFKFAHFVWHFFVLFGTIIHFIAIYGFLLN